MGTEVGDSKRTFDAEVFQEVDFDGSPETFTHFSPADVMNLSKVLDDYDYDIETSHNTFFWDELLPTLVVYCLTFVLGLVGNALIVFTISRSRKMKSTTNVFLASLASSDLLLIVFCIPVKGFHRLYAPKRASTRSTANSRNLSPSTASTYRKMKTVLGSILIKEDEEDEVALAKEDLDEEFSSQSGSGTTIQPEDTLYESNASVPPQTTSEKLTPMESSLVSGPETASDLELLMAKLSDEIKKCSQFIRKLNIPARDKLSVKFSMSDSKIELERERSNKKNGREKGGAEYAAYPVSLYSAVYTSSVDSESGQREETMREKASEAELRSYPRDFKHKHKSKESPVTDTSLETSSSKKNKERTKKKEKEFPCCDDCKYLKKRIVKLEKELERIEKKMPFYPVQYQDSIKNCLERLKTASETVLKRLRSCARMRFLEHRHNKSANDQGQERKRSSSAPEPVVKEAADRKLILRSTNSDYKLNVGMEITMENADPVTGQKLHPEFANTGEQEGNIQCKVYRDGEDPLLVVDTDFAYNPKTGMLFKRKKKEPQGSSQAVQVNKVQRTTEAIDLTNGPMDSKPTVKSYACVPTERRDPFEAKEKTPKASGFGTIVCQMAETPEVRPSKDRSSVEGRKKKSKESLKEERKEKGSEGKKSRSGSQEKGSTSSAEEVPEGKGPKKSRISWFQGQSRIPTRKKPLPSSSKSKADSLSQKSSAASFSKSETSSVQEQLNPFSISGSRASIKLAKLFSFTWTFGFFLCKLVHYMQSVSAICSVLTLTAMSLERYYAIVHPIKAQYICTISQAKRIITGTWVSAFLLAVPILFAQVHLKVGVKVEAYWCVRDWENKTIWRAHELYMMFLILVVPTGVMAVAYTAICWEIWEVIQRRQDMTAGKGRRNCRKLRIAGTSSSDSFPSSIYSDNARRKGRGFFKRELADDGASVKQVIKMLIAVVVIYVFCWGPVLIDNVLQAYGILSPIRIGWLKYMGTAFHLMAYFNSCINPIIYGFMSKNFRESFKKTLCCVGKKQKTALRSFSLSQTRNTSIKYAESSFGKTVSIALHV